jgi:hypothetical protein
LKEKLNRRVPGLTMMARKAMRSANLDVPEYLRMGVDIEGYAF